MWATNSPVGGGESESGSAAVAGDLVSGSSTIACAGGGETIAGVRYDDDEAWGAGVDVSARRLRVEMTVVGRTSGRMGGIVAGGAQFITDARPNTYY